MFDYEIIEDDYGRKLAIDFEYDQETINAIKSLPWEETHRRWDGDRQVWTIDYNDGAVSLFERELDVMVPPDIRPGESDNSGKIEFVVPEGYSWFFVQGRVPAEVDRLLYQELAYSVDGAEYSDSYQNGTWDGWNRLYSKDNHGAPRGLIDRAANLVEDLGYDVTTTIEGDRSGSEASFGWEFPYELRDYQTTAVDKLLANRGGILSLPTGTGKTVTCMKAMQLESQKTLVLVHTKELLYQWADEIRDGLDVEPGLIGDGNWTEGEQVTVAIVQTLMSRGTNQLDDDYGMVVFDECHRTSAADQMHDIGMDIDCDVRVGLSATPWRSTDGEELKIEGAIGGVVHEVSAETMIDEGFLARPEFELIQPDKYQEAPAYMDYHEAYRTVIELQPSRNRAIAERARDLAQNGYKVLVNVNRIKQGKLLEYALNGSVTGQDMLNIAENMDQSTEFLEAANNLGHIASEGAVFLSGRDDNDHRQKVLDEFENGDIDILVSTLLKEGVNIPDISAIVLAQGGKSDIQQIQTIGRALRPANGDHAKIVDVEDHGRFFRDQFKQRQGAIDEYYGSYGPDSGFTPEGATDLTSEPPEFDDVYGE